MTGEQHQPEFEKMPVSSTIGIIGYAGRHSAEIRTENRLCIEPRWQLGHLLHGRKRKQSPPTHRPSSL